MSDEKIPSVLQYLEFSTFRTFPFARGPFSRGSHAGFRAIKNFYFDAMNLASSSKFV